MGGAFLRSSAPSDWEKMVSVLQGMLKGRDSAMGQFLLYLGESNALGKKLIIEDTGDTSLKEQSWLMSVSHCLVKDLHYQLILRLVHTHTHKTLYKFLLSLNLYKDT